MVSLITRTENVGIFLYNCSESEFEELLKNGFGYNREIDQKLRAWFFRLDSDTFTKFRELNVDYLYLVNGQAKTLESYNKYPLAKCIEILANQESVLAKNSQQSSELVALVDKNEAGGIFIYNCSEIEIEELLQKGSSGIWELNQKLNAWFFGYDSSVFGNLENLGLKSFYVVDCDKSYVKYPISECLEILNSDESPNEGYKFRI